MLVEKFAWVLQMGELLIIVQVQQPFSEPNNLNSGAYHLRISRISSCSETLAVARCGICKLELLNSLDR